MWESELYDFTVCLCRVLLIIKMQATNNITCPMVLWTERNLTLWRERTARSHCIWWATSKSYQNMLSGDLQLVNTGNNLGAFDKNISLIRHLLILKASFFLMPFSLLIFETNLSRLDHKFTIEQVLIPASQLNFHLSPTNLFYFSHNSTIPVEISNKVSLIHYLQQMRKATIENEYT